MQPMAICQTEGKRWFTTQPEESSWDFDKKRTKKAVTYMPSTFTTESVLEHPEPWLIRGPWLVDHMPQDGRKQRVVDSQFSEEKGHDFDKERYK